MGKQQEKSEVPHHQATTATILTGDHATDQLIHAYIATPAIFALVHTVQHHALNGRTWQILSTATPTTVQTIPFYNLLQNHPHQQLVQYVCRRLQIGFDIGFHCTITSTTVRNAKLLCPTLRLPAHKFKKR